MLLSGNGFKNTNLKEYHTQTDEERYWNSLSMKHHKSNHIMTTFGYGFSSRKKHVCCREFSSEFDKQIWKAFSFYRYYGTWYPYACKFLNLLLHLHLLLLLLLLHLHLLLLHLQGLQELLHLLL